MSIKDYSCPSLTTDLIMFRINEDAPRNGRKCNSKHLQVLLVLRKEDPQKNKLALPGGFVNIDEDIEANIKRKVKEKTGVCGDFYMEQLYTFGALDRDERGRVISVSYIGLVNEQTYKHNNDGSHETFWVNVEDALLMNLAFDHNEMILCALKRLRGKAEYTDVLFNLMPAEFTINDCQMVYELILGKKLNNFKRSVNKYLKPLSRTRTGKQFRPAELYAWNRDVE